MLKILILVIVISILIIGIILLVKHLQKKKEKFLEHQETPFGIAFGGGGWASTLSEILVLQYMCEYHQKCLPELIRDVQVISGDSGAGWFTSLLFFSQQFIDNLFNPFKKDFRNSSWNEFYEPMEKSYNEYFKQSSLGKWTLPVEVILGKMSWYDLIKFSMNKYGNEVTKGHITTAGNGKYLIQTGCISTRGITSNYNCDNIWGLSPTKVIDSKYVYNSGKKCPDDKKCGEITFFPMTFTTNNQIPNLSYNLFETTDEGIAVSKVEDDYIPYTSPLNINVVNKADPLSAAAASGAFFALLENEKHFDLMFKLVPTNITNYIRSILYNKIHPAKLLNPNITPLGIINKKTKQLNIANDGKIPKKVCQNKSDHFVFKIGDGGYATNTAAGSLVARLQSISTNNKIKCTIFSGCPDDRDGKPSLYPSAYGDNSYWVYDGVVDHLFGIDKRTFRSKNCGPDFSSKNQNFGNCGYGEMDSKFPPQKFKNKELEFANPFMFTQSHIFQYDKSKIIEDVGYCSQNKDPNCTNGKSPYKDQNMWVRVIRLKDIKTVENHWFGVKSGYTADINIIQISASATMFPGGIPSMKFDDYKPKHLKVFFDYMNKHKDVTIREN
jgi:hypothetical protein